MSGISMEARGGRWVEIDSREDGFKCLAQETRLSWWVAVKRWCVSDWCIERRWFRLADFIWDRVAWELIPGFWHNSEEFVEWMDAEGVLPA